MSTNAKIYELIGQAMKRIGAIGKDSTATNTSGKQMYKFRGIDAVYNALNPVMADLGLFICPEVLEQTREERKSTSGGNLIYSILKVKFTMYAPDGSSVAAVVIGEGMDSGDKASNKAMSVAMKYAMFQLFCIPTEEMVDPDSETPPESKPMNEAPDLPPAGSWNPRKACSAWCTNNGVTAADFGKMREALIAGSIVPNIKSGDLTPEQFDDLIHAIEANYPDQLRKPA